jgi:hypothetical protein
MSLVSPQRLMEKIAQLEQWRVEQVIPTPLCQESIFELRPLFSLK